MSQFAPALKFVLQNEKGIESDLEDKGGITNAGISIHFLNMLSKERLAYYGILSLTEENASAVISGLKLEQISSIYENEFWLKTRICDLKSQDVSDYIFDCYVNPGAAYAFKMAQEALWTAYGYQSVVVDGILGDKTIEKINGLSDSFGYIQALMVMRAAYYKSLNNDHFIHGWLKRAYEYPTT